MITFEIPIRTVSETNVRGSEHWSKRHARVKAQKVATWVSWKAAKVEAKPPCTVTLTRIAPLTLDADDNLNSSMKSCRDQIAELLGVDDRSERVKWKYKQEKSGSRDRYGVRVEIET